MNNYQAPRKTKGQRAIMRRRFDRAKLHWSAKWGRRFRQRMIDRKRYWAARRIMADKPDMTLGQGRLRGFLDELRKAA